MAEYCLDANIFIDAWDVSYPKDIFGSLWEQLTENKERIVLIKPIYDEIDPSPSKKEVKEQKSLKIWLNESEFSPISLADEVKVLALEMENEYETDIDSKGASSVDIKLIAYAKYHGITVVTLEATQPNHPQKKRNYKIPLICQKKQVDCIDFISFLRGLRIKL